MKQKIISRIVALAACSAVTACMPSGVLNEIKYQHITSADTAACSSLTRADFCAAARRVLAGLKRSNDRMCLEDRARDISQLATGFNTVMAFQDQAKKTPLDPEDYSTYAERYHSYFSHTFAQGQLSERINSRVCPGVNDADVNALDDVTFSYLETPATIPSVLDETGRKLMWADMTSPGFAKDPLRIAMKITVAPTHSHAKELTERLCSTVSDRIKKGFDPSRMNLPLIAMAMKQKGVSCSDRSDVRELLTPSKRSRTRASSGPKY